MAKQAHITSRPDVAVGDRALALCGKDFKVKTQWEDIPLDKRICRYCVDTAISALTEADDLITVARMRTELLLGRVESLATGLVPDRLILDLISDARVKFDKGQAEQRAAKEIERKAKVTCTCEWSDMDVRTTDYTCPIHGDADRDEVGVVFQDDPEGLGESEMGDDGRPPIAPESERKNDE